MKKEFLSYTTVRNNTIKLAFSIYQDGFVPDVIYISLRGGAYLGNVMSEYFKLVRKKNRPVFYAAVVARSYTGIKEQQEIMIDGWTYDPEYLRNGDRVMLIDDIFDSGRTINRLVEIIMKKGIPRRDIKVVVHDYKIIPGKNTALSVQPDYYCRKHVVESPEDDVWIHYLSHELEGLTQEELASNYYKEDPALEEALSILYKHRKK